MKKKKHTWGQIVLHLAFVLLCLCYVLPMILCVSISFTDETALLRDGYSLIPSVFSTEAYKLVFRNPTQLLTSYGVTAFFTLVSTVLAVIVMALLAYPLSRPNYYFKSVLSFYVFFTMLFSGGMVPTYLLITKYLGMKDSIWVYILPGLVSAYYVMIIRTSYRAIPGELIESARIEGASELLICFKIMLPLNKPVLASIGFLFLVSKWNEWMASMLYITNPKLYSLQYLLQRILNEAEFLRQLAASGQDIGGQVFPTESFRYAMALVAAGPVLVVFPFFQKHFAKGMTLGSVKG